MTPAPIMDNRGCPSRWRYWAIRSPTDHISPAGSIKEDSPAGSFLKSNQVAKKRTSIPTARAAEIYEVMMRGTFANIRIQERDGPRRRKARFSTYKGETMADLRRGNEAQGRRHAAGGHRRQGIWHRLVRANWAAKGTILLGVPHGDRRELRAHPPLEPCRAWACCRLQFKDGDTRETLGLDQVTKASRSAGWLIWCPVRNVER